MKNYVAVKLEVLSVIAVLRQIKEKKLSEALLEDYEDFETLCEALHEEGRMMLNKDFIGCAYDLGSIGTYLVLLQEQGFDLNKYVNNTWKDESITKEESFKALYDMITDDESDFNVSDVLQRAMKALNEIQE